MAVLTEQASYTSDFLLRDIAKKIQLKATEYNLAEKRYNDVYDFLNKDGNDAIYRRIYPQGSMAVGATIASKLSDDEFDIDVILELNIDDNKYTSKQVLDWLQERLAKFPCQKVDRQSRCVTLEFAKMHLDVTPAILLPGPDRTSRIFHSNTQKREDYQRSANPWGFAEWFKTKTAPRRVAALEARKDMVSEPVPDQQDVDEKSMAVISLQLIKRWRNILYNDRDCRKPPSILLAKLIADNAREYPSLLDALEAHVAILHKLFTDHHNQSQLIKVANPMCADDKLSDRWPEDLYAQERFAIDLARLTTALQELRRVAINRKKEILSGLFGERPTLAAIEDFAAEAEKKQSGGGLLYNAATGGSLIGTGTAQARKAPSNTFFGGDSRDGE